MRKRASVAVYSVMVTNEVQTMQHKKANVRKMTGVGLSKAAGLLFGEGRTRFIGHGRRSDVNGFAWSFVHTWGYELARLT